MRKMRFLSVLVVLVFLVLSGCTIEYNTSLNKDGSGEMVIQVDYTQEEVDALGELTTDSGASLCQQMWSESQSDLPPGSRVDEQPLEEGTRCTLTMPFANLDELRSIYEDTGVDINRLEIVEDKFYYDVEIDLSGEPAPIEIRFVVKLSVPGSVGENNADEVGGRTLTWNLEMGSVNRLTAESSLGTPAWLWWLLGGLGCLGILAVAVAAGVGLFFYLRSRKKETSE